LMSVVTELWHMSISAEIGKDGGAFLADENAVAAFESDFVDAGSVDGVDVRAVGGAAIDDDDFVVEGDDPGVLFGDGVVGDDDAGGGPQYGADVFTETSQWSFRADILRGGGLKTERLREAGHEVQRVGDVALRGVPFTGLVGVESVGPSGIERAGFGSGTGLA